MSIARVTGAAHLRHGAPCQDAGSVFITKDGQSFVAVVADGAGSGRFSHIASDAAVNTVIKSLQGRLEGAGRVTKASLEEALRNAQTTLVDLERQMRVPESRSVDFACTCVIAVLQHDSLLLAQVGDGAVVVRDNGRLECITPPEQREYVNETWFLNSFKSIERLSIAEVDSCGLSAIAVMTDGVQHMAIHYPSHRPHSAFFQPLFRYMETEAHLNDSERSAELRTFLDSEQARAATDDDKTLIVGVRV